MPRRLPHLAFAAVLAVTTLAACAPQPAPAPTSLPSVSSPEPSPTAEVQPEVVLPGERPPTVVDGDCAAAISPAQLSAITGLADAQVTRRDQAWTRGLNAIGGLSCEWEASGTTGRIEILPQAAIGDAALSPDQLTYYFEDCDAFWVCSWQWEDEDVWITGSFQSLPEMDRDVVDAFGAELGADIGARVSASGQAEWRQDRAGWWAPLDCGLLADATGAALGAELRGEPLPYSDPPSPSTVLADLAIGHGVCTLSGASSGESLMIVSSHPSLAWDVPWTGNGEPVDAGTAGIEAYRQSIGGWLGGDTYELTDGVNALALEVAPGAPWAPEAVLEAMATLAADGMSRNP